MTNDQNDKFADAMLRQIVHDAEAVSRTLVSAADIPLDTIATAAMDVGIQAGINSTLLWLKTRGLITGGQP